MKPNKIFISILFMAALFMGAAGIASADDPHYIGFGLLTQQMQYWGTNVSDPNFSLHPAYEQSSNDSYSGDQYSMKMTGDGQWLYAYGYGYTIHLNPGDTLEMSAMVKETTVGTATISVANTSTDAPTNSLKASAFATQASTWEKISFTATAVISEDVQVFINNANATWDDIEYTYTSSPGNYTWGFNNNQMPTGFTVTDIAGTGAVWVVESSDTIDTSNLCPDGSGSFACADSNNWEGDFDSTLTTPAMDLSSDTGNVYVNFVSSFYPYNTQIGDVDVSNDGGATWTNIWTAHSDAMSQENGASQTQNSIDVSSLLAGSSNAEVRFHMYNVVYGMPWQIDNLDVGPTAVYDLAPIASPTPIPTPLPATTGHVYAAGASILNTLFDLNVPSLKETSENHDVGDLAISLQNGKYIYTVSRTGLLSQYDLATDSVIDSSSISSTGIDYYNIRDACITPDGHYMYLLGYQQNDGSNEVAIINLTTLSIASMLPIDNNPDGISTTGYTSMTISDDGSTLYVSDMTMVYAYDIPSMTLEFGAYINDPSYVNGDINFLYISSISYANDNLYMATGNSQGNNSTLAVYSIPNRAITDIVDLAGGSGILYVDHVKAISQNYVAAWDENTFRIFRISDMAPTSYSWYYDGENKDNAIHDVTLAAAEGSTEYSLLIAQGSNIDSFSFDNGQIGNLPDYTASLGEPIIALSYVPITAPIPTILIGSGFLYPMGIVVDANENVYVADYGHNAIKEVYANGTIITIGSGFSSPTGVCFDTNGNVYVADKGNDAIKEVYTNGTIINIGSGFLSPAGVYVDAYGNVYVADYGNNAVKEVYTNGTIVTIGNGFSHPSGVYVDADGNVYVADTYNNAVKEVYTNGTIVTIGNGFSYPSDICFDTNGNMYVTDYAHNEVKEIYTNGTIGILGAGFSYPFGVAVDASGNVYVADTNNNEVVELLLNTIGAPVASFTVDQSSGSAPLTVHCTDTSTKNPTSWNWTFNYQGIDPQYSTDENPSFTFTNIGTSVIHLEATNQHGTSSYNDEIIVNSPAPTNTSTYTMHGTIIEALSGQTLVVGASVIVRSADTNETLGTTTTNSNGNYTLTISFPTEGTNLTIQPNGTIVGDLPIAIDVSADGYYNERIGYLYFPSGFTYVGSDTWDGELSGGMNLIPQATPTPTPVPTPEPTDTPTPTPVPTAYPTTGANSTPTASELTMIRGSPAWTATIAPISTDLYNNTSNAIFGSGDFGNMSIDNFIGDTIVPFIITYGPFFWAAIFGLFALMMFDREESGIIPVLLTFIAGVPIILWQLPLDWQKSVGTLVILILGGLLYAMRKKR